MAVTQLQTSPGRLVATLHASRTIAVTPLPESRKLVATLHASSKIAPEDWLPHFMLAPEDWLPHFIIAPEDWLPHFKSAVRSPRKLVTTLYASHRRNLTASYPDDWLPHFMLAVRSPLPHCQLAGRLITKLHASRKIAPEDCLPHFMLAPEDWLTHFMLPHFMLAPEDWLPHFMLAVISPYPDCQLAGRLVTTLHASRNIAVTPMPTSRKIPLDHRNLTASEAEDCRKIALPSLPTRRKPLDRRNLTASEPEDCRKIAAEDWLPHFMLARAGRLPLNGHNLTASEPEDWLPHFMLAVRSPLPHCQLAGRLVATLHASRKIAPLDRPGRLLNTFHASRKIAVTPLPTSRKIGRYTSS
ncbi:hypothetical protein DPMN_137486 [Dreissena polymorpha]|uniref:Uncharacterized protein n=1 Tax=Dreissena polymorpha TaxID=45954 RepID=A0A9D4G203_DREPO|nr:hypothetical protein DPMN_137486 [Dreissena polymorpha]